MSVAAGRSGPRGDSLLSVEAARAQVLDSVAGPLDASSVSVRDALGMVLAAPVMAALDLPPWDNSAMDGYAARAADVAAATEARPAILRVVGEAAAGVAPTGRVGAGTAVRIATGAPLPDGADVVIPVEWTTPIGIAGQPIGPRSRDATGPLPASCAVHQAAPPGNAIRRRGEDVRAGSTILGTGAVITPLSAALAAGAGADSVTVHRRPRVAILVTGDEVRSGGTPLGAYGIPDANGPALRAAVTEAGGEAIDLGIGRDVLDDVVERLRRGAAEADVIVVSGGVSVGPYDVVRAAFEVVGRVDLWRVAVQPGKPFAFGLAPRDGSGGAGGAGGASGEGGAGDRPCLLFGLPGNPVSSIVSFELFVRPALRRLAGHKQLLRPSDRAVLLDPAHKQPGRRAYLRAVAEREADGRIARDHAGRVRLHLARGQGSHMLSALAAADSLAIVPEAVGEVAAGSEVEMYWLDHG